MLSILSIFVRDLNKIRTGEADYFLAVIEIIACVVAYAIYRNT